MTRAFEIHGDYPGDMTQSYGKIPVRESVGEEKMDWLLVLFACTVSASSLFAYQLFALTVIIGSLALIVFSVYRPRVLIASFGQGWLLLVFMAWMLLSTIWSQYPGTTLYYGIQAGATLIIGLQLGHQSRHNEALVGLFLGWSLYTLSSLVFGHSVQWGSYGDTAFSGLNKGKNYAGDTAVLGFILALHTIRWGFARGRLGMSVFAAIVALSDLYIIVIAKSSGAILGASEAIALFAALSVFMRFPLPARTSALIGIFLLVGALAVTQDIWLHALQDQVLAFFHKSPTLTGRLYLWTRADEVMSAHPWMGVGYNGFWVQGNLDAEGLWRSEGIVGRMGFNFHNSLIEMRVHLGWIGVVMGGGILIIYSLRLLKEFALNPGIDKMTWLIILFYEVARMPYESLGISPFAYTTMVLVGALTAGGGRRVFDVPVADRHWQRATWHSALTT